MTVQRIQVRRGTPADWMTSPRPVLAVGELGYDITNKLLKIGDGVTEFVDLPAMAFYSTDPGGGAPLVIAYEDKFNRTVSSGWGTADTGGSWSHSAASAWSTTPGFGKVAVTTATPPGYAQLFSVSQKDIDFYASMSMDSTISTGWAGVNYMFRAANVSGTHKYYGVTLRCYPGNVWIQGLTEASLIAGTLAYVKPSSGYSLGETIRVRVRIVGSDPTRIQAKGWLVGNPEPAAWAIDFTDSTAGNYQSAGRVGLWAQKNSSTADLNMSFSEFKGYALS